MAERAAKYIAATVGVEVEVWDRCGRQGAADLRFEHNGRSVAVEVKSVVDPRFRAMGSAIASKEYVADSRLTRLWIVNLEYGAQINDARRGLPGLLAQLETRGWLDLDQARCSEIGGKFDQLRVSELSSHEPTPSHPAGFIMLPVPLGEGEAHVPTLSGFISGLLGDGDSELVQKLIRQLGNAAVDERHAFLFIGWENSVAWPLMMQSGDLPVEPPTLPPPIDGVWIASFSPESGVLAWLPGIGWIEGRRECNGV